MKKRLLFLMFLLVLPIVAGQDWIFNSESVEMELDISSEVELVPKSSRYSVDYVIANLSFIPRDGFQEEVLNIETEPFTEVKDYVAFRWDDPKDVVLRYSMKSDIKTFNKIVRVRDKVNFPLGDLSDEVRYYTRASESIDSDDKEVIKLGSEIIQGEDDLYAVVFKLGEWTKENIEYDLSTLTESVSQKASWVLRNREGVCDELTNLFIAMNRALGIPAKFISGVAYTNAEDFEEGFGPHGWAEVYFPGYGWVPFDVTYGEFGFVDAGHIKLKESLDVNQASTQFQWVGENIDIKTRQLDINTEVKEKVGSIGELISMNARAIKDNVGFGSYNLVEVDLENLKDYYVATELRLSKPREIEVVGEEKKVILLEPGEEKKINWIIRVSDELEGGFVYTFPFMVGSVRNVSSSFRFDVIEDGKEFSLEGMDTLVKESEEEKSFLGNVDLRCSADKEGIYEYEKAIVKCNVRNIGNIYLEGLNVCLEGDCRKLGLGITQEEEVSFNFKPSSAGKQEIVVKASNGEVSKNSFFDITVYDEPSIEIDELTYPNEVRYKEMYELSFILNKRSKFAPSDVSIRIEPVGKEWELNQLNENRKFVLKMYGSELKVGENKFNILVNYMDKRGKKYSNEEEFSVSLVDVGFFRRIIIFFKNLF